MLLESDNPIIKPSYHVQKFTSMDGYIWDQFISKSKNATFLFKRDFIEYHNDRFEDYSLMIFNKETLMAVFPGHLKDNTFYSHLGLSYGGIVCDSKNTEIIEEIFEAIIAYLKELKIRSVYIKMLPIFLREGYHSAIEYFIFKRGGILVRRDLNFIIDFSKKIEIHKSKQKKIKRKENSLTILPEKNFKIFWEQILIPTLKETYNTQPVHSLAEIEYLGGKFPDNILHYNVYYKNEIVAGMTLFVDKGVVKSQYGAANLAGKEARALDVLYLALFEKYNADGFRYFDLGTTTIDGGYQYNKGLTRYKEELGAYSVNLDHYSINLL
ncbi:MAG: GNAT family N-acetyltransferase [Flavobacteriaceae bacterium]|nr:GNAT family N-acetyltransferase [Flavobacteriaceae bacterium]